jgi:hypothetical protein
MVTTLPLKGSADLNPLVRRARLASDCAGDAGMPRRQGTGQRPRALHVDRSGAQGVAPLELAQCADLPSLVRASPRSSAHPRPRRGERSPSRSLPQGHAVLRGVRQPSVANVGQGQDLYFFFLGQRGTLRMKTGCRQPFVLAADCEHMIEELYRRVQLPEEWVTRLPQELEDEIERQATAADMRVALTRRIAELADERRNCCAPTTPTRCHSICSRRSRIASRLRRNRRGRSCPRPWRISTNGRRPSASPFGSPGAAHAAYLRARPKVRVRFN